jgi:crossover junction endodeoxyribonuclease RuvC
VKIVGLDLSLTSTGLAAICDDDTVPAPYAFVDRITSKPTGTTLEASAQRLAIIVDAVHGWVHAGTDLVVIEGLAYSSTNGKATERAGLWWLTVNRLLRAGYRVAVVTPTARAKYATGKGNAAKDAVLAAVIRRYPDVELSGNDEADALVLAAMGARWLGLGYDSLPATHIEAMDKVAWPNLEAAA